MTKKEPQQELILEDALELLMNASVRNNSQGRKPEGFICLHVDDLYMAGSPEFEKRVLSKIRKDFNVGSEDKIDIMFVGQRITWKNHEKFGNYISCDQKLAVDQLEEIKVEKHMKDNMPCSPSMHTAYRSVLGQLNWLQSRAQYVIFVIDSLVVHPPLQSQQLQMFEKSIRQFVLSRAKILMEDFGQ